MKLPDPSVSSARPMLLDIWHRYREPAIVFFGMIFSAGLLIGLLRPVDYKAKALLAMDSTAENEWEVLAEQGRGWDYEQQLRSRAVLEPVLELAAQGSIRHQKDSAIAKWLPLKWRKSSRAEKWNPEQKAAAGLQRFQKKLSISRTGKSNTLGITVSDRDPERAALLANAVADSFIAYRRKTTVNLMEHRLEAVEAELAAVQEELGKKISGRNKFLQDHGWDDFALEFESTARMVAMLKDAKRTLEAYQADTGVLPVSADMSGLSGAIPGEDVMQKSSLIDVSRRFAEADARLTNYSSSLPQDNLGMLRARFEKEMLETILKDRLKDPRERYKIVKKQLEREQAHLQELSQEQPWIENLETTIKQLQERRHELLNQKSKAEFALTQWKYQPPGRFEGLMLLDPALVPLPASKAAILLRAVILSLFAALMGAALLPIFLSLWNSEFASESLQPGGSREPLFELWPDVPILNQIPIPIAAKRRAPEAVPK